MKKFYLVIAVLFAAATACAQDVSLCELMSKPMLSASNVFTSSIEEIAIEWGNVRIDNKEFTDAFYKRGKTKSTKEMSYCGCPIKNIIVFEYSNKRNVSIEFDLESAQNVKKSTIIKQLKTDIAASLGMKMPKGNRSHLYLKENGSSGLVSPFCDVLIVGDDDELEFQYSFRLNQYPSCK